jgi:hypothetical protein
VAQDSDRAAQVRYVRHHMQRAMVAAGLTIARSSTSAVSAPASATIAMRSASNRPSRRAHTNDTTSNAMPASLARRRSANDSLI